MSAQLDVEFVDMGKVTVFSLTIPFKITFFP